MATTNSTKIVKGQLNRVAATESLSITDMLMLCLRYWKWFILSLVIFMGAATLYLLTKPDVYTRSSSILVKSGGDKSDDIKLLENLGVNNLSSNIKDEIVAIHSPAVVYEMVKRLHLDLDYQRAGFFRNTTIYADNLPIEIVFDSLKDNEVASFTVSIKKDDSVILSKLTFQGEKIDKVLRAQLGKRFESPYGPMTVRPTIAYKKGIEDEILVTRVGYSVAASKYGSALTAYLQPDTRNIINIVCDDVCISRADNILNTIVNIYNENWVKNRNQISVATNAFIKERLAVIEQELGHVESDISNYKSARAMPSVDAAAGQAMSQQNTTEAKSQELSNQLYMVRYMRNFVANEANAHQLLPASSGIHGVEAQITEYNRNLLERNNLVANSSEQNPLVQDLDISLKNLRNAILITLENEQNTLSAQLTNMRSLYSIATAKLSANPQQAKELLSIERQQKVKESLYLFLLQKREENELSQAFTAYNTRIIAAPWGSLKPTSPNRNKILLYAFIIALALPAAFFIIRENTNTKVRGRKDLENMSIPFIGELPIWKPEKGEKKEKDYQIVVQQHKRDITNEAFRVVRTNLEFMFNTQEKCKTIMLTSFNPGSGKTFIAGNLASSFGIRGSKVICIDLDLRRASLSEFVDSPKKGLTNYLSGREEDYHSLIVHNEEGNIDFLPVGKIPPNPTELLYSPKFKPMLEELRQQYDFLFIDCPPVDIVADATIIGRLADITIFVVRAGLLERSMLPELEKTYNDKKFQNMAMLLNGTDASHHYGYHRYGYGYGHYGNYGSNYYGSKKSKKK